MWTVVKCRGDGDVFSNGIDARPMYGGLLLKSRQSQARGSSRGRCLALFKMVLHFQLLLFCAPPFYGKPLATRPRPCVEGRTNSSFTIGCYSILDVVSVSFFLPLCSHLNWKLLLITAIKSHRVMHASLGDMQQQWQSHSRFFDATCACESAWKRGIVNVNVKALLIKKSYNKAWNENWSLWTEQGNNKVCRTTVLRCYQYFGLQSLMAPAKWLEQNKKKLQCSLAICAGLSK